MLEIAASLLIGTLVVVSVMAGVMKLDTYLWQRKRVRELDTQREAFMKQRRLDQAHHDLMMRMGMNPGYMAHTMCTASRSSILTDMPRPEPMTRPTTAPEWDGVAVEAIGPFMPWRSINETHQEQIKANEAAMNRLAENARKQLDDMMIDHMTALPAPDVFKLPSPMLDYLRYEGLIPKEACDDRDDEAR